MHPLNDSSVVKLIAAIQDPKKDFETEFKALSVDERLAIAAMLVYATGRKVIPAAITELAGVNRNVLTDEKDRNGHRRQLIKDAITVVETIVAKRPNVDLAEALLEQKQKVDEKDAEIKELKEALHISDNQLLALFERNYDNRVEEIDKREVTPHQKPDLRGIRGGKEDSND